MLPSTLAGPFGTVQHFFQGQSRWGFVTSDQMVSQKKVKPTNCTGPRLLPSGVVQCKQPGRIFVNSEKFVGVDFVLEHPAAMEFFLPF